MKITDFMTNDWASVPEAEMSVSECGTECLSVYNVERQIKPEDITDKEDIEINGIPLTADFFLCNDFTSNILGNYHYADFGCLTYITAKEYSDSVWKVTVSNCELSLPDEILMVSYIHQFQQFLRLCGCPDIANNVKLPKKD